MAVTRIFKYQLFPPSEIHGQAGYLPSITGAYLLFNIDWAKITHSFYLTTFCLGKTREIKRFTLYISPHFTEVIIEVGILRVEPSVSKDSRKWWRISGIPGFKIINGLAFIKRDNRITYRSCRIFTLNEFERKSPILEFVRSLVSAFISRIIKGQCQGRVFSCASN